MSTQTIRQSTILISSGKRMSVYSSLDQVPAELKHKLMASTSGSNSATILLADRAGREEIVRALRGMPSHIQARLTSPKLPWTEAFARKHSGKHSLDAPVTPAVEVRHPAVSRRQWDYRAWSSSSVAWCGEHWPELLLPVGVAIGLWALLTS